MTEPSQYFKGRTVQEQMNEVIGYVDTRAAEVATTAIASDVAQVHQDASAAAASAAAAAGTLANAVKKTGEASQSITGNIAVAGTLSGGTVTVPTPVNNTDAASKKYVDDQDALNVQLAGSQAITGTKTVPTETTGTFSDQIATSNKVKNELDNYAPMMRLNDNQDFFGIKRNLGTLLDRVTYVKNTIGAESFVPVFKIPSLTRDNRYLKGVFLISGRTVPTSISEIVWNDTTITKTDILGTQTNVPAIYSDTNGDYWLCMKISANNAISMFELISLRNAGYDERLIPINSGDTPDMTGWTLVIS